MSKNRTFNDMSTATRLREIMRRVVQSELDRINPADRFATVQSVDASTRSVTVVPIGETDSHTYIYVGGAPFVGDVVRITGRANGRYAIGPFAMTGGELYAAQHTAGNVTLTANVESTIVTLGAQLYRGGRNYDIVATVSSQASSTTTRMMARILNVTDTLRVNIHDLSPTIANVFTTYRAIYRFSPTDDVTKEFAITAQNANSTGNFIVCGSAPASAGGAAALIQAIDQGPQ